MKQVHYKAGSKWFPVRGVRWADTLLLPPPVCTDRIDEENNDVQPQEIRQQNSLRVPVPLAKSNTTGGRSYCPNLGITQRGAGHPVVRPRHSPFTMPMNWHFECGSCGKEFPAGFQARENHCHSTGHAPPRFECDSCHRWFNSEDARWQHMNSLNHFEHECSQCNETYPTSEELKQHEIDYHYYCADCDRAFKDHNSIKMVSNRHLLRGWL